MINFKKILPIDIDEVISYFDLGICKSGNLLYMVEFMQDNEVYKARVKLNKNFEFICFS